MIKKISGFLGFLLIAAMAVTLLLSLRNLGPTIDEVAHLPAGISYVTGHGYQLNPEHPPLFKLLAGWVSNKLTEPTFPTDFLATTSIVNPQYEVGQQLLFNPKVNAASILFFGRLPMVLVTILFACLFFIWTRRKFGAQTAVIATLLFTFSPILLAHGNLVTNDVSAAFGMFIGLASFIWFLEKPSWSRVALTGLVFGIAQLMKFSLVILGPVMIISVVGWVLFDKRVVKTKKLRSILSGWAKTIVIFLIGLVVIYLVYLPIVRDESAQKQMSDTNYILTHLNVNPETNIATKLVNHSITRPLATYAVGVEMALKRAEYGTDVYLLGQVYKFGQKRYFPIVYATKEALATLIFLLIALVAAVVAMWKIPRKNWKEFMFSHRIEAILLGTTLIYWLSAIFSGLNIGVRHLIPIIPLMYILAAVVLARIKPRFGAPWVYPLILGLLSAGLIIETWSAFPFYLSYYNPIGGGTMNGYKVSVDSNYDWGQDITYLRDYVQANGIKEIAFDYFGSADPTYYLGSAYKHWDNTMGRPTGWFAISASNYASYTQVKDSPDHGYDWLKTETPVARAGTSILIFDLR